MGVYRGALRMELDTLRLEGRMLPASLRRFQQASWEKDRVSYFWNTRKIFRNGS